MAGAERASAQVERRIRARLTLDSAKFLTFAEISYIFFACGQLTRPEVPVKTEFVSGPFGLLFASK